MRLICIGNRYCNNRYQHYHQEKENPRIKTKLLFITTKLHMQTSNFSNSTSKRIHKNMRQRLTITYHHNHQEPEHP